MKKGLFDKRIPTAFALIGLIIVISITTVLVQSGIFYVGKAAPDSEPENFAITNISESSFTATFTTTGLADAVVAMQESNGRTIIFDDRDKSSGKQSKYYSHHITVPNLEALTTYRFKILIAGKEYDKPEYTAKTGPKIASPPPAQNPIFGTALQPDTTIASDALILAKTSSSQLISTVTNQSGEFLLPTNSLKLTSLTEYLLLTDQTEFSIQLLRQNNRTTAIAPYQFAQNLPVITLSEQYKFSETPEEQMAVSDSALEFTESGIPKKVVSITSPYEGEAFIDFRPLFEGTALPNTNVQLVISNIETKQIISKADGKWSYRPTQTLSQGEHQIIATTLNDTGSPISIQRNFEVFPLGSQVSQTATPSATPTTKPPTPTIRPVTPTATPRVSIVPSATPTVVATATPTITPTASPTVLPSPTTIITTTPAAQIPTKRPPIQEPGATENALALTGLSLILIIAGTAMLFML